MNRNRIRAALVTAGIAAMAVLAGCSSSGGAANSAAGGKADQMAGSAPEAGRGAAVANPAAGAAGSAPNGDTHFGGVKPGAGGAAGATDTDTADVTSLALIRTASLEVRIAKAAGVAHAADEADRIAVAAGGTVYSDDRTAGKYASASLTLKVPPQSLEPVLNQLAALGKEVQRTSSTKDVTSEVADVASRTLSARKSLARLRALYTEATKVGQVIAIESEIATREADLESLEAQQRALSSETATSTINLSLIAAKHVPPPVKPHHSRGGFIGGLTHGWDAFVTTMTALVTALGAVLPFLLLVAFAGAIGWRWRHRLRRPRPSEPSATP
ncbi:MAG TPA: DUF4349 domain-containing protein [Jatrophihabitantaceae bacterium]|nr:DUF4349 domain-containing protein [Jatrophihabitantaceae bacterium]